jgi:UDP-N-acetylmuramoylalanine--D-glutamate ligase
MMMRSATIERAIEGIEKPGARDRDGAGDGASPVKRERRVLVLGAARSGRAVAELLIGRGDRVTLADRDPGALDGGTRIDLAERGVEIALGREEPSLVTGQDLVVISPGVPIDHPLVAAATAGGVEVVGELEIAASLAPAPLIAVTGTDGKSTTVTLIGAILAAGGRLAPVAGNVGRALAAAIGEVGAGDLLVVEVSSFQLESVRTFRPEVGVLLNLAADHLDRHRSLEAYQELKLRLFARQQAADDAVVPADWGEVPGNGRRLTFGTDPRRVALGATVIDGWITRRTAAGDEAILPATEVGIPGPHNLANALAAVAALIRYELPAAIVARAVREFQGLPHRLEKVAVIGGVTYVNDSKATNLHSLSSSLVTFAGGVHLIAGGRDKGGDFESVAHLVRDRIRHVYRIGEARARLRTAWPEIPGEDCPSLEAAVSRAALAASPGEVVLLAPGCASFDMFRDFEERGDRFRSLVLALAGGEQPAAPGTDPGSASRGSERET